MVRGGRTRDIGCKLKREVQSRYWEERFTRGDASPGAEATWGGGAAAIVGGFQEPTGQSSESPGPTPAGAAGRQTSRPALQPSSPCGRGASATVPLRPSQDVRWSLPQLPPAQLRLLRHILRSLAHPQALRHSLCSPAQPQGPQRSRGPGTARRQRGLQPTSATGATGSRPRARPAHKYRGPAAKAGALRAGRRDGAAGPGPGPSQRSGRLRSAPALVSAPSCRLAHRPGCCLWSPGSCSL